MLLFKYSSLTENEGNMAKAVFGEYAAYDTKAGIRFMKNSKLISETNIPPEAVGYLRKQLGVQLPPAPQQFAPPSEEEKARLRAESLQVPAELQRTPQEMEAATPLTPDDFDDMAPAVESQVIEKAIELGEAIAHTEPLIPTEPSEPDSEPQSDMSDFLEQVSIHTASLQDMVDALYNRFGIYTVWLGKLPEQDEVNPLTAEQFTKYHLGIAYQASIYATNKGLLDREPEAGRKALDQGREAAQNWSVDARPKTVGEARRMNTFDSRTSPQGLREEPRSEVIHVQQPDGTVRAERREIPEGETGEFNGARARYDKDEDEPIVEPQFGKQVIRPNW